MPPGAQPPIATGLRQPLEHVQVDGQSRHILPPDNVEADSVRTSGVHPCTQCCGCGRPRWRPPCLCLAAAVLSRVLPVLQARLLKSMMNDQGGGFEVEVQEDSNRAEATIKKCLYHTIFEKEQKPHLLQVCCCSQDAPWCAPHRCRCCCDTMRSYVSPKGGVKCPDKFKVPHFFLHACRFDGLESYKLKYSRPEWLGKGDGCCRVEIRTTAAS